MTRPKLLQVCNVGQITGGTAACAWTITRALPGMEHHVVFLSAVDTATRTVFSPVQISSQPHITSTDLAAWNPTLILLHNTPRGKIPEAPAVPCLQYLHSEIRNPAPAGQTLCCSSWLAQQLGMSASHVLWQPVPKCFSSRIHLRRRMSAELIVGRICTPTARKWPADILPFYANLAGSCPHITWEFVGCPIPLQHSLANACKGRVQFYPAGWQAREHLGRWDVLLYSNPRLTESFGRTVAEALRAGCIPVVDQQGGFSEQIPARCGYLCRHPDEFAHALRELSDPGHRQQMSDLAQSHADQHFSLRQFAIDFLKRCDHLQPRHRSLTRV